MTALGFTVNAKTSATANVSFKCWPVHKGSIRAEIVYKVTPRERAYQIYREARNYDRAGRKLGNSRGTLGISTLRVLEALIYDFLSYTSGRLDPSYERIATVASLARSTVASALVKLRDLGIIAWTRRCTGENTPHGWQLRQSSNAYRLNDHSQWPGYRPQRPETPPPHPSEIGSAPPLPEILDTAAAAIKAGASTLTGIQQLELDHTDPLARALAALGRAVLKSENQTETGSIVDS